MLNAIGIFLMVVGAITCVAVTLIAIDMKLFGGATTNRLIDKMGGIV